MKAQSTLASARDQARDIPMISVKIESREGIGSFTLPDGNVIHEGGEHTVKVYEDRVPEVMAMVETDPRSVKAAKESFALAVADKVRIAVQSGKTAREVLKELDGGENSLMNEARDHIMETTGDSWEAHFHSLVGRGVLPLIKAEALDGFELEPQRAREVRAAKLIAEATRDTRTDNARK